MCVLLQEVRLKEGIVRLQPQEEPLRSELLSGKFTVLVGAANTPRERHSHLGIPIFISLLLALLWWCNDANVG